MKGIFLLALIFSQSILGLTQSVSPHLLNHKWNAQWLTSDDDGTSYGVHHFRKNIALPAKPSSFIIHVSADNRYKLFVNGTLVSLGPARGDLYHWNFETVDIAPYLKAGENCLAAVVWNFGKSRALAQISYRTGFILQGNTTAEEIANTDTSWKYLKNPAYSPLTPDLTYTYYALGPGERVDLNQFSPGWELQGYDDSRWIQPKTISVGLPKGVFDWFYNWMLVPRTIPPMEITAQRFESVREVSGIKTPKEFPAVKSSIEIPPHTKVNILLDQGHLTNAYPVLTFSRGKDAVVTLQYAEALFIDEGSGKHWKAQNAKGNRNEVTGKRFVGVKDEIVSGGQSGQVFVPLEFRTFRYVRCHIETQSESMMLEDISSLFTEYPFQLKAKFESTEKELQQIFETGWRTARLCAGETYVDCPYYEQLQYFGDTRIQCLISLFNSGDDRLMRNAIEQADRSRLAEGITLSRYPSLLDQQIPPFSLWWIGMLHDYYWYRDDTEFVKKFLPGMRGVLAFFSNYQQEDGRLKNPPYWEFSDWAETGGWKNGVAPKGDDGCSAVLDFQLLMAYQTAADLEEGLGLKELAAQYRKEVSRLTAAIRNQYWDGTKKLFADTNEKKYFSQHTNALAVLTKIVEVKEVRALMEKTLSDSTLTQATIYFKYYVNQALVTAGMGDLYLSQLDVWKENLTMGMTTWAEISDINHARSDCHAWGASPNIEFFRIVLGIDSGSPGFNTVLIDPHLGNLKRASGAMPHPKGEISVSYSSDKDGKWKAVISLPIGTSGTFVWQDKSFQLHQGENKFDL